MDFNLIQIQYSIIISTYYIVSLFRKTEAKYSVPKNKV